MTSTQTKYQIYRPRRVSLALKLNLLIIAIVLALSVGLIVIAYNANSRRVDKMFQDRAEHALNNFREDYVPEVARYLWQMMQTDGFKDARRRAVEANDPSILKDWMSSVPDHEGDLGAQDGVYVLENDEEVPTSLYGSCRMVQYSLQTTARVYGLMAAYLQYEENGVTYNLIDSEEDLLYIGSIEPTSEAFAGYEPNGAVPPTIYYWGSDWLCTTCVPMVTKDGVVAGQAGVDIDMTQVIAERHRFLNDCILFMLSMMALAIVLCLLVTRRIATQPLRQLAEAATGFAVDNTGYTKDDVIHLDIHSRDEIDDLYREIQSMQYRIVEYTEHLTQVTAEKERIGAELNIATSIQAGMLPRIFPPFPERGDFDIFAIMDPAKEVGGDFYDFFLVDDDHLCLVIADVSGKGVPAALFMVVARTLIKNLAQQGLSPAEVLSSVNAQLCDGNDAKLFVTVWLAILELSTGRGLAANAGHEHPALRRAGGEYALVEYRHAPPVATFRRTRFREHEFELHPGDSLFVYTDGVTEAVDSEYSEYGTDRLLRALNRNPDASPRELLSAVRQSIDAFVVEAPQFDDITMLGFRYTGVETGHETGGTP